MSNKLIKEQIVELTEELNEQIISAIGNPQTLSRIEIDIILATIRDLYKKVADLDKIKETVVVEEVKPEVVIPIKEEQAKIIAEEVAPVVEEQVIEIIEPSVEVKSIELATDLFSETPTEKIVITIEPEVKAEPIITEPANQPVAEKKSKFAIPSLKSAIGINEKFLFINSLFGGDMQKYNQAIESLDAVTNYTEALSILSTHKKELNWNEDQDAYQQFSTLLERRFL